MNLQLIRDAQQLHKEKILDKLEKDVKLLEIELDVKKVFKILERIQRNEARLVRMGELVDAFMNKSGG